MYLVEYLHKGAKQQERIIATEAEIRQRFFKEGKTIVNLKKQSSLMQRKASKAEIIAAFTAIGNQLAARVRLEDSIAAVISSFNKDSQMIPILTNVRTNISNGKQLSACLSEYIYVFGVEPITMITTGEETGKLPETLITVANHMRKTEEVKSELLKGMMQPIATLILAIVAMFISSTFIIPKITKSLSISGSGKKADGSIFLEILKNMSWIMPTLLAVIVALVVIVLTLYRVNQEKAEQVISRIPVLRELIFFRAYFMIFASLSNMLAVGIRLQDALPIASKSIKLITIKKELNTASDLINNGRYRDFASAFKLINTIERQMLQTATDEDIIEENLKRVSSRFYEMYIDKLRRIGPTIQYMVMLFVVLLVVLMFMGIMLPYISMMQNPTG